MLLSELTAPARRLALVGLAKNTGKTVALDALLRESELAGRLVAVTSVGRDGEQYDAIDARIEKPAIDLVAGSIVATTDSLLRASGLPRQVLARTGIRTPLGEVVLARLKGPGAVEVAGPSAAAEVREVADAMLSFGADQVLIDGAIDRRAASSPDIADALVMSTGAVLSEQLQEVVARTRDAVELVRLPALDAHGELGGLVGAAEGREDGRDLSFLIDADGERQALPPRFVLTADGLALEELLADHPAARALRIGGALPEAFLAALATATRRSGRSLEVIAADPTKVFLSERGVEHYLRQGVRLAVLRPIALRALTVNPVAPRSHRFDSAELRARLGEAIEGVPIFDVKDSSYATAPGVRA